MFIKKLVRAGNSRREELLGRKIIDKRNRVAQVEINLNRVNHDLMTQSRILAIERVSASGLVERLNERIST